MFPTAHGIVSQVKGQSIAPIGASAPLRHSETQWGTQATREWEVGWRFKVGATDLLATHLQLYQAGGTTETVNLWRVSDQALLASAPITTLGGWAEATIPPVTLQAGEEYAITRYAGGASRNYDRTPSRVVSGVTRSIIYDPAITLVGTVYNPTGGYPSTSGANGHSVNVLVAQPPTGYRFYRLHVTDSEDGSRVRLGRIEFRATVNGPDVTGSGAAWEDSLSSASFPADNLFVGGTSQWITPVGVTDASVYYDFGTHNPQTIVQYGIRSRNNLSQTASEWTLQASNDLETWDVLHSVTGETGWSTDEWRIFTI